MSQDTNVNNLIINKLTQEQYDGITTPDSTQLYMITDTHAIYLGSTLVASSEAEWGNISGDIADQADLQALLNAKQDELTAGDGISITAGGGAITIEQALPYTFNSTRANTTDNTTTIKTTKF